MSASGNWTLLERLNNDEFLKVLPNLRLENVFLTQVFIPKKKWLHMFEVNVTICQAKCTGCNRQVKFQDIKSHLKQIDHQKALRANVKQFYHPFYTYGKGDINLSRGETVLKEDRESALRELNTQTKSFKKDCLKAKHFAELVKRKEREVEDEQLLQLTLKATITNPDDMFVKVCLPFEDIPKLLFCITDREWKPVASYKALTKKANFHCNICAINCSGIGSLNSHSNGYTHKLRQLEIMALRYESSSKVNKNCCIEFGDSFSFSVKEKAKEFFKDKMGNVSVGSSGDAVEIPSDIIKKIRALDELVPNTLTSKEAFNPSKEHNPHERNMNLETDEIVGHLGVEYVLKIVKHEKDRDPTFECGLCEFVGDGNKIQRHILNYDHKKKYLDLHYSDTVKKYESSLGHMRYMEFRAVMSEIVDQIAIAIEKTHSRSLPYTVMAHDYNTRRPDLIAEVYALLHASQNRGPSFANVLSQEEVRNLRNRAADLADSKTYKRIENIVFTAPPRTGIYLHQTSHDPVKRFREFNAKMQNKTRTSRSSRSMSPERAQMIDVQVRGGLRSERSHNQDHRTRSRSPRSNVRDTAPMRDHRSNSDLVSVQNQNIWDVYRREIATAAIEIELAYDNYRKNPESHPLYEEEWNYFWQRRKKDLEREGVNHRAYNFQPEWVHYFKQRIEQLFGEALHRSQINIRRKLEIPLDAEEDCQHSNVSENIPDERRMKSRLRHQEEIDEFRSYKRRSSIDHREGIPPKKRHIPEERFAARSEHMNLQKQEMADFVTNISDNHSNVVHVLRLMTALEDHLGSIGGKVMDLLSNALQLEKNFRGVEFEAKILTASNCNLLETAMEKLKGILFAGLLDEKKISGFNRIIQYTTNLLKYAEKMGWRREILPDRNTFHVRDNPENMQTHMNIAQSSGGGDMKISNEKPLSDTLMDLVSTSQRNKQSIKMSEEQFIDSVDDHSMPLVCPPPPSIKGSSLNSNSFVAYNNQRGSGLATFNTKLSLDHSHSQQQRQHQSEMEHLHRSSNVGGNNSNNNSFKNNNDVRTNVNSRPNIGPITSGPNVRGNINNNSGPGQQFKNTQFIPNMSQNNAMYQGGGSGGGNRNQTWSRWNNIN